MVRKSSLENEKSLKEAKEIIQRRKKPLKNKHKLQIPFATINCIPGTRNYVEIACFRWEINNIVQMRTKYQDMCSDYFSSIDGQYEMWLYLYPNGSVCCDSSQLGIRFWIHDGVDDQVSKWPFRGDIMIKVRNKARPDIWKVFSKRSQIDTSLLKPYGRSDIFHFKYSDLNITDGLQPDSLIVECLVNSHD